MMNWYRQVHISKVWESFANPFVLENGLEQLTLFFSEVKLFRYEDNLQITEIEPIVAYIRSSIRAQELSETELIRLQQDLEKKLQEKGEIFVSKDSGLFEAVK
jgi:hypothetical protein